MDLRALHGTQLLVAAVFVASTVVLTVQLINPSPVVVTAGSDGTEVAELSGYFGYRDMAVATVAACLLGATGTYLVTADGTDSSESSTSTVESGLSRRNVAEPTAPDDDERSDELLETRREEWERTAEELVKNEREVYDTVLEADGVLGQSEIVERTDLSKATVSRTLDGLESKNLVERKRRGMGNVVLLL
ncbi:helix-turn-helix transcriptional regulator [Natronobacterium texcoconense]|uniref:MarR family protein n=1 Tax=Natronobacterium texcoconense TaxID=1095778 RepID=A0A1H1IQD2_NATTX|nr:MarR family transcriptional regulator [Natronobacterium texcoconense]SDR39941.1 MarR family protein [Natronobacterium texcoconense]